MHECAGHLGEKLDERLRYFVRNCQPAVVTKSTAPGHTPSSGAPEPQEKARHEDATAGHLYLGSLVDYPWPCPVPRPLVNGEWVADSADATVLKYIQQCTAHANEEYIVRAQALGVCR